MKKADKIESDKRVLQVSEWLLDGESSYKIVQFASKEWKVSERQVYKYIEKARKVWDEAYQKDLKNNLNWHLIARKKLFNKAVKNNDLTNARNIAKDIAELQGLYTQNVKVSGDKENPVAVLQIVPPDGESNGNGSK